LVQASATFALLICKALRHYTEAVSEDLEAGNTTLWPAVASTLGLGDRTLANDATESSENEVEGVSYDADDEDPVV
jgi:hypothetical protein